MPDTLFRARNPDEDDIPGVVGIPDVVGTLDEESIRGDESSTSGESETGCTLGRDQLEGQVGI